MDHIRVLWEGLEANRTSISAKADKAFWHREQLAGVGQREDGPLSIS